MKIKNLTNGEEYQVVGNFIHPWYKVKSTKNQKDKEKPFTWALPKGETTALNTFQRFKLWLTEVQVEVAVKKETKNFCSARIRQIKKKSDAIEGGGGLDLDLEVDSAWGLGVCASHG